MRTRVATDISALFLVMVEFVSYKTADGELWNSIPLLECGATCLYTIPEFSVITVKLRMVKFQCFIPNHKSHFPGNISVLEFFSIESSLKAIPSDYGSNKERNVHLEMRNLKQTELHRLMNRGKKG